MWAEVFLPRVPFDIKQVSQAVANAAGVHETTTFVVEQRRAISEAGTDVVDEPGQHQAQASEHRHPPGPGIDPFVALP